RGRLRRGKRAGKTARTQAEKPKRNPAALAAGFRGKDPGNDLLSHARCTLPSARARFTSEFGMGSGGSTQLLSPGRGWRVARPMDWPMNAHTLSLVASEQTA